MIGNARTFVPPLEKTGCPDNVHETHLHAPRHPSACLADRAARAAQNYGTRKANDRINYGGSGYVRLFAGTGGNRGGLESESIRRDVVPVAGD